jgi:hypothetical protein
MTEVGSVNRGTASPPAWAAGRGGRQQVQTHPRDLVKAWGWVAVHASPGVFQVYLDGNTGPDFGPVDAPCTIATELPTLVIIDRIVVDGTAQQAAVSWGLGCPPYQGRGRVLTMTALVPVALAPWESEADLTNPAATADWLTAGGVVIDTFAGRGYRPVAAANIRTSINTTLRLRAG